MTPSSMFLAFANSPIQTTPLAFLFLLKQMTKRYNNKEIKPIQQGDQKE
jgi:hypothetical protein